MQDTVKRPIAGHSQYKAPGCGNLTSSPRAGKQHHPRNSLPLGDIGRHTGPL
jgi:hypothetical protein